MKVGTLDKFLENLNKQQKQVVKHIDGPAIVIAGAGTGKTTTLVGRLANLVVNGVEPESILLLTFTKKAAEEMILRAKNLIGKDANIKGGTFHSFCLQLLRRNANLLGYKNDFRVYDREESELILQQLLLSQKSRFYNYDNDDLPKGKLLADIYSKAKNKYLPFEEVIKQDHPNLNDVVDVIIEVFNLYEKKKKEEQAMDFDDLILNGLELLRKYPKIVEKLSQTFKYIMVDEYQDTNKPQAEILYLIGKHQNVVSVGDDAQSIYGFRGANFENMFEFQKHFPNTKVYTLEVNYRSVQPILNLANAVLTNMDKKYTKVLRTSKAGGSKPYLFIAKDDSEESEFIVSEIEKLLNSGYSPQNIAVLMRSSYHSAALELLLREHNIDYVKVGGLKIWEVKYVKEFLKIVEFLIKPNEVLALEVLSLLLPKNKRGNFSKERFSEIVNSLVKGEFDRLSFLVEYYDLWRLREFSEFYEKFKKGKISTEDVIDEAVKFYVREIFQYKYKFLEDYRESESSLYDIAELIKQHKDDVFGFIKEFKLSGGQTGTKKDVLTLSTVHSAKGLEWDVVFVIGLSEERFPSRFCKTEGDIEEERRLFYVAVTRAKELLYLTLNSKNKPSRFLKELPSELITEFEKITLDLALRNSKNALNLSYSLTIPKENLNLLLNQKSVLEAELKDVIGDWLKNLGLNNPSISITTQPPLLDYDYDLPF